MVVNKSKQMTGYGTRSKASHSPYEMKTTNDLQKELSDMMISS